MRKLFVLLISIVVLSACAPVHRFTQLRKLPREYSENYSIEGIRHPEALPTANRGLSIRTGWRMPPMSIREAG